MHARIGTRRIRNYICPLPDREVGCRDEVCYRPIHGHPSSAFICIVFRLSLSYGEDQNSCGNGSLHFYDSWIWNCFTYCSHLEAIGLNSLVIITAHQFIPIIHCTYRYTIQGLNAHLCIWGHHFRGVWRMSFILWLPIVVIFASSPRAAHDMCEDGDNDASDGSTLESSLATHHALPLITPSPPPPPFYINWSRHT